MGTVSVHLPLSWLPWHELCPGEVKEDPFHEDPAHPLCLHQFLGCEAFHFPKGPSTHNARPLASSVSSRAPALPLLMPRFPFSLPLSSSFVGPLPLSHWGHPRPRVLQTLLTFIAIAGLSRGHTEVHHQQAPVVERGTGTHSGALQSTRTWTDTS